jgi:hypothetical protein
MAQHAVSSQLAYSSGPWILNVTDSMEGECVECVGEARGFGVYLTAGSKRREAVRDNRGTRGFDGRIAERYRPIAEIVDDRTEYVYCRASKCVFPYPVADLGRKTQQRRLPRVSLGTCSLSAIARDIAMFCQNHIHSAFSSIHGYFQAHWRDIQEGIASFVVTLGPAIWLYGGFSRRSRT